MAVDAYRQVLLRGDPAPAEAVAKAIGMSSTTGERDLTEARRRGVLGPAIPNRAGEADRQPLAGRSIGDGGEGATRSVRAAEGSGG